MIQCQKCGQTNAAGSNFCRACGNNFATAPPANGAGNYEYAARQPYSWKTDELQAVKPEARKTEQINRVQPLDNPTLNGNANFAQPQPFAYQQPQYLTQNYRCPQCGSGALPIVERKVSTAGWIVFSVLLIFTWIFFWIGLLMKEDVRVCPACRAKIA
jgi:RNA polymerase subunit RPABC4/transcription elongation factor Spt4